MLTFSAPSDIEWLAEKLRDEHDYLGPTDYTFYPTTRVEDDTLHIEARRPDGTPVDEDDRANIQAIIDAHDGTPPAEIQAERAEESNARTRARDVIQTLENIHSNWDTLTNAQKDSALKLVVIAVAKLARLMLRKFDA